MTHSQLFASFDNQPRGNFNPGTDLFFQALDFFIKSNVERVEAVVEDTFERFFESIDGGLIKDEGISKIVNDTRWDVLKWKVLEVLGNGHPLANRINSLDTYKHRSRVTKETQ